MAKVKKPSPFKTHTLGRSKYGTVKMSYGVVCADIPDEPPLWYFARANDGFYERVATKAEARTLFEKKINFEKHQLTIY